MKIKNFKFQISHSPAQILVLALVFLFFIILLSAALFTFVANFRGFSGKSIVKEQATGLAEAGIERALIKLNTTSGYTGESEVSFGQGTFILSVPSTGNSRTITSTACIPSCANPRVKRVIKVDATNSGGISVPLAYAFHSDGFMANNSSISVSINHNIRSNSTINGGSGHFQVTGTAAASSTINNVDATGGLFPNSLPNVPLPALDLEYWKQQANINNNPITCSPTCDLTGDIGPRQYNGSVRVTAGAQVNVKGPIYVTGTFFLIGASSKIKLDNSFGSQGTVIVADDFTIRGGLIETTNASPKGYLLLAAEETVPSGIVMNDTASICNSAYISPGTNCGAIFYTRNGRFDSDLQNRTIYGAIVAKEISLNWLGGYFYYDPALTNATFTANPSGGSSSSWQIKKGTYRSTK